MRVLVTGSEGTIGRALCEALRRLEYEVCRTDLMHAEGNDYMRSDISKLHQLERVFEKFNPDVVYNLAAEFGRHNGECFPEQLWESNAVGTKNVLNLCRQYDAKLIHASSSEVYGEGPFDREFIDEGMTDRLAIKHHNDYAMSKWVNEGQIRNHLRAVSGDVVTLRFFNSYGPGEKYHDFRSVVCLFCYRALKGLPFTVYRGYHRVFMYIDDFIPSLVIAMDLPSGSVVNIGGEEYRSVEELYEIIKDELGDEFVSDVEFLDKDAHNTVNKRPDITLAKRLLGHESTIDLREGVKRTLEWMKEVYG